MKLLLALLLESWKPVQLLREHTGRTTENVVRLVTLDEFQTFAVVEAYKDSRLLARPESVEKAHDVLAESVGKLTLEATTEIGKRTYLAHGKVDFFGEAGMLHSRGAGGGKRTERLPLRFEWQAAA